MCKKIFCCVKCRKKHENTEHKVNPECDICFYGEIISTNSIIALLPHIREQHWPLHCKKCKRIFGSIDELILHNLCPIGKNSANDISNKTPLKPISIIEEKLNNDYNSPPIMYPFGGNIDGKAFLLDANNFLSRTTSTPMQGEGYKCFLDNMSGPITPVEGNTNVADDNSQQNVTYSNESKINRKVTFNETPLIEVSNTGNATNNTPYMKGCLKKPNAGDNSRKRASLIENTLYETAVTDDTKESDVENHDTKGYFIRRIKRRQIIEESPDLSGSNTQKSMWNSMASIVKTVLTSLLRKGEFINFNELILMKNFFCSGDRGRRKLLHWKNKI